ncbi:MAG: hypothetical protein V3T53_02425 [Phycisphaerales bacterium]
MAKALGKARYPLIIILVLATVTLFIWTATTQRARARAFTTLIEPSASELSVALIRAGTSPEALAAAGLSAGGATMVVSNLRNFMIANPAALDVADTAFASAKQSVDELKRLIQSGQGAAEDVTAYNTAKTQLSLAKAQRQNVLDDFFTAATASLGQAQKDTLTAVRGNSDWDRPTEFLVLNHTDADWVELRECLANERIAADQGEEPDPDAQTTLSDYRSATPVAAAKANLDANLAVIAAAWDQAIGD